MLSGEYDPETAHVMRTFVEPGDVCIDVGANVGAHVLLLAKLVAPTGRIYAFEPGPPIFERLKTNLALNPGLSGVVTPERLGISDTEGKLFSCSGTRIRATAAMPTSGAQLGSRCP